MITYLPKLPSTIPPSKDFSLAPFGSTFHSRVCICWRRVNERSCIRSCTHAPLVNNSHTYAPEHHTCAAWQQESHIRTGAAHMSCLATIVTHTHRISPHELLGNKSHTTTPELQASSDAASQFNFDCLSCCWASCFHHSCLVTRSHCLLSCKRMPWLSRGTTSPVFDDTNIS
jgi:hypothetical protein